MLLLFYCIFLLLVPLLITRRFHRDRLDRWRYGFAYILLLFQCIFLFLLYFRLPAAFTATVSIVGGTVLHTFCCFLHAVPCFWLLFRWPAAFTATVSSVGGTVLHTFCCFFIYLLSTVCPGDLNLDAKYSGKFQLIFFLRPCHLFFPQTNILSIFVKRGGTSQISGQKLLFPLVFVLKRLISFW